MSHRPRPTLVAAGIAAAALLTGCGMAERPAAPPPDAAPGSAAAAGPTAAAAAPAPPLAPEVPALHATWPGPGTVFQYAVPVQLTDDKGQPRTITAYAWVPPAAERIRGLLIGGTVLFEGGFAAHPAIRAACAEAGLGIVLFSPHLDAVFAAERSAAPLERALADLAAASGRAELASAPLIPYGHSVGTIWSRNVLFWKPERIAAAIFFKGGFSIPEGRSAAEVAGIPIIHIQGRFEEFGPGPSGVLRAKEGEDRTTGGRTAMRTLAELRAGEPRLLLSLLVEDGSTHYPLNPHVAAHLGRFLVDAAAARIAPDGGLRPVDPAVGALTSAGDLFAPPAAAPAPAAAFAGDPKASFWHPSLALAEASERFHAVGRGKRPQFVSFADAKGDPQDVGHDMRMKVAPVWVDADTVQVRGAFRATPGKLYPAVEGPVGHAEGPVRFAIFAGPLEQVGDDRFRATMDERLGNRAFILAYHPGDAAYRWAEQPGLLRVPARLADGKPQAIDFPAVGTIPRSRLPLALAATSDSGLPVRFHVDHGPARVVDGRLELADVPRGAAWPLRIEIVAWQYGSAVEPKVASAAPVRQAIAISAD